MYIRLSYFIGRCKNTDSLIRSNPYNMKKACEETKSLVQFIPLFLSLRLPICYEKI